MKNFLECKPSIEDLFESLSLTLKASDCDCNVTIHTYLPQCMEAGCEIDYENEDEEIQRRPSVLVLGVAYSLVFLIGTIGNGLVIFVVNRYKRMKNVTNVFLASLSTADLCLIWLCAPFQFMKYLSYSWFLGIFVCYFLHYVQQFTMFCSVLTLTTISVERFLAIGYPMKSMWLRSIGRAKKMIAIIWFTSAVLAIPAALKIEYRNVSGSQQNISAYMCFSHFPDSLSQKNEISLVFAVYQILLLLVLPVSTMIFCYTRIACILYAKSDHEEIVHKEEEIERARSQLSMRPASSLGAQMQATSRRKGSHSGGAGRSTNVRASEQNRKQIVHMLVSIVIIYTICWCPTLVDDLLVALKVACESSDTGILQNMRMVFALLAYSNSCINPIVYAFVSQNFKTTFKMAITDCGGAKGGLHNRSMYYGSMAPSRCHSVVVNGLAVHAARNRAVSYNAGKPLLEVINHDDNLASGPSASSLNVNCNRRSSRLTVHDDRNEAAFNPENLVIQLNELV